MKTKYSILLLLAAVTAFSGCDSEEIDTAKPQIVMSEPAEEEAYAPGSAIHFVVTLSDNVALASYKVNIHGAFDGHTHSAVKSSGEKGVQEASAITVASVPAVVSGGTSYTRATDAEPHPFERTWMESEFISQGEETIAGKQQVTINHMLMLIPDSIEGRPVKEGHYHLTVYCTDSSGQESFIAREIEIAYNAGEHQH